MLAGYSGRSHSTRGINAAAAMATTSTTGCQLPPVEIAASAGRKISEPVAKLAVRMPIISPRLLANQRLTMIEPSTSDMHPQPSPVSTPQVRMNCHGSVMNQLAAVEAETSTSAVTSTRRMPKRCISAAENGPTSP
jgi:hypothetical protein